MSKLTLFEDNEIGVIRRVIARLYAEDRLSADQLRELAQSLEWAVDQGIVQEAGASPAEGGPVAEDSGKIVPLDYAAAARAIHLHLKEFCRHDLTYPDMVAEAARRAGAEIDALRQQISAALDQTS